MTTDSTPQPLGDKTIDQLARDFERLRLMSLEIQSLIKQGVKKGVQERLLERDRLLREWFGAINGVINMTRQQELVLQDILQQEQALVANLKGEQARLAKSSQKHNQVRAYQGMGKH